jgi:putative phage-type endonuclease
MPKFLSHSQGTAEWLKCREGRITASRIRDVMDFSQPSAAQAKEAGFKLVRDAVAAGVVGEPSAKRIGYRKELIIERMTGQAATHFVTKYMDWGSEHEDDARTAYEIATGVMCDRVGFAVHGQLDYSGASPDSLVGDEGMLEIKCPEPKTHLEYLQGGVVPEDHKWQMYWGMACCERQWCDFVSYDPIWPDGDRIFCKRLEYDAAIVADITARVMAFHEEVESAIAKLRAR